MKIVNQVFIFMFLTIRKVFLIFSKLFPVSQRQKLNLSEIFTTKNPTHLLILGIILFTFIVTSLAILFGDSELYISSSFLDSSMHVTTPVYAQDQHEEDDETVIKHGSEEDFIPRLVHVKYTDGQHEYEGEEIDDYSLYDPHHAYDGDDEANDDDDEEEEDYYNDDLNWRIEEFLGMMKKGWREEMLEERLHYTLSKSASKQDSRITMADYNLGSTTQTRKSTSTTYHYAHEQVADKLQIISLCL